MTEETQPSRYTVVAWAITALLLLLVLRLELVVAFLAGLLVYEIVRVLANTIDGGRRAQFLAAPHVSAVLAG